MGVGGREGPGEERDEGTRAGRACWIASVRARVGADACLTSAGARRSPRSPRAPLRAQSEAPAREGVLARCGRRRVALAAVRVALAVIAAALAAAIPEAAPGDQPGAKTSAGRSA